MRVKKDKCYLVVTKEKEYVQGAFPYNPEGLKEARAYIKQLEKKNRNTEYKIKSG